MGGDLVKEQFVRACKYLLKEKIVKNKSQLAYELGLSPSLFSMIFNKGTNVSPELLKKLFRKYKINYNYIFFGQLPVIAEDQKAEYKKEEKPIPDLSYIKKMEEMESTILRQSRDISDLLEEIRKLRKINNDLMENLKKGNFN